LVVFIPVVWGAGMVAAAGTLTFRRGALTTFAVVALTLPSTTYFPAEVVPSWAQRIIELNPLTIALEAARTALLDGGSWAEIAPTLGQLAPVAVVSLALGFFAFKLALRRERRLGTLGLY
jgi:ABC-2 type transport system permease protein